MGACSVGEGSRVNVPPVGVGAVVVSWTLTGPVVAVTGTAVARGKTTAGGIAGIGVDAGAMTTGVGEARPHPLKRDITTVIVMPKFEICSRLICRSFHSVRLK